MDIEKLKDERSILVDKAIYVVVVAAGQGTRLKAERPKAYCSLGGKSVLEWTLAALCAADALEPERIQVVIDAGHQDFFDRLLHLPTGLRTVCTGGATRADSVQKGLQAFPAGNLEIEQGLDPRQGFLELKNPWFLDG